MDAIITWLGGDSKAISFAILAGVAGFLAKSLYDLWMARRKDRLDRVNQQLKLLYGPLYAQYLAGHLAWGAFRSKVRPGKAFFGSSPPPTEDELQAWRIWMTTVFAPLHNEMVSTIYKNADLLDQDNMPEPIRLFLAHVAAYRVVFKRWEQSDYTENVSVSNYPEALGTYLQENYRELKHRQRHLLGWHLRRHLSD